MVQLPSHYKLYWKSEKAGKKKACKQMKIFDLNNSFKSRAVELLYPLVAMELTTGI